MKRWIILAVLLCIPALSACVPQEQMEEPSERNVVTITVPDGVTKATIRVPDGRDIYLCHYTGKEGAESLVALLNRVGERPERLEEDGPYAGHEYEIVLFCADGSEENYFWSDPYVRQGDGPWCELPYEKDGWLGPWLQEHKPDEITKVN